jgi:cell division septum initiation protein DivIVA
MRYHRAVFVAGVAVGFLVGSRAGRERYDQIVKYTRKAMQSPPARRATQAVSNKATELSKSAAAKAADLGKSAATRAPKAAGSAARKARTKAGAAKGKVPRVAVPKVPVPRTGTRFGFPHLHHRPDAAATAASASSSRVNGAGPNGHGQAHGQATAQNED